MMRQELERRAGIFLGRSRVWPMLVAAMLLGGCAAPKQEPSTPAVELVPPLGESESRSPKAAVPRREPPGAAPAQPSRAVSKGASEDVAPSQAPTVVGGAAASESPPGVEGARLRARAEFERARREVDIATTDCVSACRALESLDRAVGHLCQLVLSDADQRECSERRDVLEKARERVRLTCGVCPRG